MGKEQQVRELFRTSYLCNQFMRMIPPVQAEELAA
jgi:hypothetical protein